jgi:hypothetical protein
MKINMMIAAILVTLMSQISWGATDNAGMCLPAGRNQIQRGGETWPWGMEVPFPWRGIQGIWMADVNGCSTYFTFKIVKNSADDKILQIHEVDPATCAAIAKGAGYEDARVVMAVMNGKNGPYNMEVHSFHEADVIEANNHEYSSSASNKVVTMMTVNPVSAPTQTGTYQLYKISTDPDDVCKH